MKSTEIIFDFNSGQNKKSANNYAQQSQVDNRCLALLEQAMTGINSLLKTRQKNINQR